MKVYTKDGEELFLDNKDVILGSQFGVYIERREGYEPLIHLMVEDDENWFVKDFAFSAHWLHDITKVLEQATCRYKRK